MEFNFNEQGFLEELLGLTEMDHFIDQDFSTNISWTGILDGFSGHNSCFQNYSQPLCSSFHGGVPFGDELSPPDFISDSSNTMINSQTLPYSQEDYYSMSMFDEGDGGAGALYGNRIPDLDIGAPSKVLPVPELPTSNMGFSHESERKNKKKKLNGQPSKNLMAERRRRKRLNDRLSMLRSVVPKISKMDRTSILADTIDYMKELLQSINNLQQEMDLGPKELELFSIFNNIVKPEEIFIRTTPKFKVERRDNSETKIEICCAGKPGLLLSTLSTLEELGLDIQQCVISCFNDFAMQASCSHQDMHEQGAVSDSEDVKQALFRNAGYGGKCI